MTGHKNDTPPINHPNQLLAAQTHGIGGIGTTIASNTDTLVQDLTSFLLAGRLLESG
jgi:hypothetical protein